MSACFYLTLKPKNVHSHMIKQATVGNQSAYPTWLYAVKISRSEEEAGEEQKSLAEV